ncbi:hypothetical protein BD310DRAFT_1002613, partial [Dichomitus squalens]
RMKGFSDTTRNLSMSAFGDKVEDLFELRCLSVPTKMQGRASGALLVDVVKRIRGPCKPLSPSINSFNSDRKSRPSCLRLRVTTDAYEAVGFTTTREQWIGTDNLKWNGPPIPSPIVVSALSRGGHCFRS